MSESAATRHRKELWGWLSYAFASEVFAVCSLSLFLPICLEQFARDNGYLLPDRVEKCSLVGQADDARCVVKLGWTWMDTASFSLYVYSASVALQALTVISLGNLADNPTYRRSLLLLFAFAGSASSLLFIFLPSTSLLWPLSALLAIIANVSFGTSMVSLNSYLPYLARSDPDLQALQSQRYSQAANLGSAAEQVNRDYDGDEEVSQDNREMRQELEPLTGALSIHTPTGLRHDKEYNAALSLTISRISSRGIATGYAAGIVLLLILLIPINQLNGSTFSLDWRLPSLAFGMSPSEGDELDAYIQPSFSTQGIFSQISEAWVQLVRTFRPKEIAKVKNTFWFLLAWFLLSDGFTTITSTAILFAKTTLHMGASSLVLIGALSPAAGMIGAVAWPIAQRKLKLNNIQTLTVLVIITLLIPAYGCLGFLPYFRSGKVSAQEINKVGVLRFGGLTTPGEMYVLATLFGSIYGAFQGYARAVFSEIIPPGEEARWFALYSITDKSSSFIGPMVVGLIADTTGNIRYGFFFLLIMIAIPIPILIKKIDMAAGRMDAQTYVRGRAGSSAHE
ncbi:autophagy-related protein 22-like protein [Cantharellus anzutake]|uniref:autophagy-related protein 22-like protein n=1 Tax=Cantharellus anzutake TaxID=1750568 RepID=UPI0019031DA5|nr:autophagy-related protein 22-like protein [Cantharellus anzutake]KAF8329799.1 autophagy-related protein 22-like protein [Cantharellus anzutake]